MPPSKVDFAIKGDFTSCAVEVNVAPCIDQSCNGQEIVDKAREAMTQPRHHWQVAKEEVNGMCGGHLPTTWLDDRDGVMGNGSR